MQKEIAIKAADLAVESIGITENGKDNHGVMIKKYLACVGLSEGFPWCIAFAKYLYIKAAGFLNLELSDDFLKLTGYTPDWENYAKKHNIWIPISEVKKDISKVKKGYIGLYYSKEKGRVYHAGICVGVTEKTINMVDGNTSNGTGVNANGDMVALKRRSISSFGELGGFIKLY